MTAVEFYTDAIWMLWRRSRLVFVLIKASQDLTFLCGGDPVRGALHVFNQG
jgi:hypothetical protein